MPKMISAGVINISSTGVMISPYKRGQSYYLEKFTSVTDYPYKRKKPVTGFFLPSKDDKKTGIFVTHKHDVEFLKSQFPGYEIVYEDCIRPGLLNKKVEFNDNIVLRDAQYQIVQKIIDDPNGNSWFVYLSQGLGKTLLSVYLIPYFNVKTLIMCFNKDILYQWASSMIENTNIRKRDILMIDSSELLNKIELGKFPIDDVDIFMCTPRLLVSYGKKHGWDSIRKVLSIMRIGLKIFDEAHRNIANIVKINALSSVSKTLYLSGDFAQSNEGIQRLYYRIFHKVPVLAPTKELMNSLKYTVAIVVFFNSNPTDMEKLSVYTGRGFSYFEYMKYQMKKFYLFDTLDFVFESIDKCNPNGYKILVLTNMVEHVEEIASVLSSEYGTKYVIRTYHRQKTPDEKKECRENATLIVSTYQSFREGIDVSSIKFVISCSLCTKIDDNQASGRARPLPDGSDAYYFMLVDLGFPYAKDKLGKRLDYLTETKIKKIEKIYAD